jgi:predicted aspartyl protease
MVTLPTGGIAVPVALDNRLFNLQVDTGTDVTTVTWETSEELGLKAKPTANGGAFLNNVSLNAYAYLDSLGIGPLHASDRWPVLIMSGNAMEPTTFGLLGADVMKNYDVEFDFFRGKFNLFAHNKCPGAVYWTHDVYAEIPIQIDFNSHIVVDAGLDGKKVRVILDTGSDDSIMSLDAARSLFDWGDSDPRIKRIGTVNINGGAAAPIYEYPFGYLSFEGIAVRNPRIRLVPRENFDPHGRDDANIVLGMSVLRQLHLYVAYDEKKLYLTGAQAQ